MAKPVKPTAPAQALRSNPDTFSANAEATIAYLFTTFPDYTDALGTFVDERADEALAAALGGDLPTLTGKAGQYLRVNAGETAAEFSDFDGDSRSVRFNVAASPFSVTDIPAWAKRIDFFFFNMPAPTSSGVFQIQIGTSSALQTSSYFGISSAVGSSTQVVDDHFPAAGFRIDVGTLDILHGSGTLIRRSGNAWHFTFNGFAVGGAYRDVSASGFVNLSGPIGRLEIDGASGDAISSGDFVMRWS